MAVISAISLSDPGDATLEIVTNEAGDITITSLIVGGVQYADPDITADVDGNPLNETNIGAGPQCVVALEVNHDGTPAVGETLTITPGIWIQDATIAAGTFGYTTTAANAVDATDPEVPTLLVAVADGGTSLTVTETVTDANGSRAVTSGSIAIPAPPAGLTRQRLVAGIQSSGANTRTPSFNIDTSGLSVGDWVFYCRSGFRNTTESTVNGNAATLVATRNSGGFVADLDIYKYQLQSGDIGASIPVAFALASPSNIHAFDAFAVPGGQHTASAGKEATGGKTTAGGTTPVTLNLTVGDASNETLVFTFSSTAGVTFTYTNLTEIEAIAPNIGGGIRSVSTSFAEDDAVGALSVSVAPSINANMGVAAILIEPI